MTHLKLAFVREVWDNSHFGIRRVMMRNPAIEIHSSKGAAMGSAVLGEAISAIRDWSVTEAKEPRAPRATEAFGSLVFNDSVQQTRLPKPVYHALRRTMTHGEALDPSVADAVASAMKEWAVEHGATHYTHWFQPLTGITAEKHDSFLWPT